MSPGTLAVLARRSRSFRADIRWLFCNSSYSARSAAGTATTQDVPPAATPTSARPAPKRSRAKKQAAAPATDGATAATNTTQSNTTNNAAAAGTETGPSGRPLPFNTKPLYDRIEKLTKTHGDLITYLHGELDRRRDWEEMMVKEMHQRHQVLLTLITSLVPVTNSTVGSSGHGQAGRSSLLASDLSTTIGRAGLPGVPSVSNMGSLQDQDFGNGAGFEDDNDYGNDTPVISLSQPAAYTQQTAGESSTQGASAGGLKRAREGDGPHYHDFQKDAGVEVDERGIIYMAGGRKNGVVPTKIAVSIAMVRRKMLPLVI